MLLIVLFVPIIVLFIISRYLMVCMELVMSAMNSTLIHRCNHQFSEVLLKIDTKYSFFFVANLFSGHT